MPKPKGRAIEARSAKLGWWDRGAIALLVVPRWRRRAWARRGSPVTYMRDRGLSDALVRAVACAVGAPPF